MRMNINEKVRVALTEAGEGILVKSGEARFRPVHTGYRTFQLWELAHIFGEEMYNGGPNLFVDNELIIGDD